MEKDTQNRPAVPIEPTGNPFLDAALDYLRQGYSVIPLHSPSMGDIGGDTGKAALPEWKVYEDRLPTEGEVLTWWKQWPKANPGIVTGKVSNLIVLDLDNWDGENHPDDTRVSVTGEGLHLWYRYPKNEKDIRNRRKVLIDGKKYDIRGDGGYIVAPPSIHRFGSKYIWLVEIDPIELPKTVLYQIRRGKDESGKGTNYLDTIKGVKEGHRHDDTLRLIGHWTRLNIPEDEQIPLILHVNRAHKPPMPEDEVIRMVHDVNESERRKKLQEQGDPAGHLAYLFDRVMPERGWLYDWVTYADPISESPKEFLFFSGLIALSASCRNEVWIPEEGNGKIFPNLWVTVLGPSSISAKSTSINTIRRLLRDASAGEIKTPDTFSLEALLVFMREHAAILLVQDELGSFLMSARRDYNAGTIELLTRLYDYHDTVERYTIAHGPIIIREPALTFLSASTVEWFKSNLRESDIRGGFVARMGFSYSSGSNKTIPWRDERHGGQQFNHLVTGLHPITSIESRRMTVSIAAREIYEAWYRDRAPAYRHADLLSHFWGRYRAVAKKASMLYELSWNPDATEVTVEAMSLATALADYHLACVEYLLSEEFVFNKTIELVRKVEKFIQERKRVKRDTIIKKLHIDVAEFDGKVKPNLVALGNVIFEHGKYVWVGGGQAEGT